ncbi:hypothetical protein ACFLYR_03390 [Chloroflexota bacterium]
MVQRKGGPVKGKRMVAFWKSMLDEWDNSHPNDPYESWKGLQMRYSRIIKALRSGLQIKRNKGGTK